MAILPEARQQKLLTYLEKNPLLTIQKMAEVMSVSSMTIHRDLDKLASEGLIQKVHGGAIRAKSPEANLGTSQKQI